MSVEDFIEELEELLNKSWSLPLSGGRTVIDAERVKSILEDIRLNLPKEVKQAKAVVADRTQIIKNAKYESEHMIRAAEEKVNLMVSECEIVKEAEAKAEEILKEAQQQAKEMRVAASDYVEDIMSKTEEMLAHNHNEVQKTRESLNSSKIK